MPLTTENKPKQRAIPDYESLEYWNGIIKMSLSKFFVLCVLQRGELHGYEIAKQVETCTKGTCSPTQGAIYPVLKEFELGGYVTSRVEAVNGRQRKLYLVTEKGKNAFSHAATAWQEVGDRVREVVEETT
jgi:DNA-binding PadR family transcriptional regulator